VKETIFMMILSDGKWVAKLKKKEICKANTLVELYKLVKEYREKQDESSRG